MPRQQRYKCVCACHLCLLAARLQSCLQLADNGVFLSQSVSLLLLALLLQPLQVPVGLRRLLQLQLFASHQAVQTLMVTITGVTTHKKKYIIPPLALIVHKILATNPATTVIEKVKHFPDEVCN